MSTFIETLRCADYTDRVFNERQLAAVLGPGNARRYGLVNRGLKDGTLVRIKRGVYAMGNRYNTQTIDPFAVAQALLPDSYVSFESALAYHGWIPEGVYTTTSVTPGRKTMTYDGKNFGPFTFHPLATRPYHFLTGVERRKFGKLTAFIATPLRALLDLVALRKIEWTTLEWVTNGMRIDQEQLLNLSIGSFSELAPVYKHKVVRTFLSELQREHMVLTTQAKSV